MVELRKWSVRCQLVTKRSVSMLVKKPAMVVDLWCRVRIKIALFQELDEFKDVSFGQVVWKSHWHHLIKEFGDAVQHWSEWGCKEADDRSTREKLLLPFR